MLLYECSQAAQILWEMAALDRHFQPQIALLQANAVVLLIMQSTFSPCDANEA